MELDLNPDDDALGGSPPPGISPAPYDPALAGATGPAPSPPGLPWPPTQAIRGAPQPEPDAADQGAPYASLPLSTYLGTLALTDAHVALAGQVKVAPNVNAGLPSGGGEWGPKLHRPPLPPPDESERRLRLYLADRSEDSRVRVDSKTGEMFEQAPSDPGGPSWRRMSDSDVFVWKEAQVQPRASSVYPKPSPEQQALSKALDGVAAPTEPLLPEIPTFPQSGANAWRAAHDALFIRAAQTYNAQYGYQPGDPEYMSPILLKAWAMRESGNTPAAFNRDPMQVNNPGDWDASKTHFAGLQPGQAMTPETSVAAALGWLRFKGFHHDARLNLYGWKGMGEALRNYNGNFPRYGEDVLAHAAGAEASRARAPDP